MTPDDIQDNMDENNGYCLRCREVTLLGGTEPDAQKRECPQCGHHSVFGIEECLFMEAFEEGFRARDFVRDN